MSNKKYKLLLIAVLFIGLLYFASIYPPVRNRLNNLYNTAYVRVTTVIRRWEISHLKDESPGVGQETLPSQSKTRNIFPLRYWETRRILNSPARKADSKKL